MKTRIKNIKRLLSLVIIIALSLQIMPIASFAENITQNELLSDDGVQEQEVVCDKEKEITPPEIISEDTSRREETVKHFKLNNGESIAVQYDGPIHYLNEQGKWTDYDNTFSEVNSDEEESSEDEKDYKNQSSDYSVRISKKTNGKKFIRLEKDGYKLSWYYDDANKITGKIKQSEDDGDPTTLEKIESEVIFEEIFKDTDLQYITSPSGVKENFILNSANAKTEFTAEYKCNGLIASSIDSKTIEFKNSEGNTIFTLSAPYMYDANYEKSQNISLEIISQKNDKVTIKTNLDKEWISAADRVFPIIVDPAVETQQKAADMDSAFVATKYPDRCYYSYNNALEGDDSGSLYVGNIYGYGQTQSYLKFEKLPTLSVADKVVDARFSMLLYKTEIGLRLDVKRVTSAWSANKVTWNTKPSVENIITDYKILTESSTPKWITFEITDLARGWYSGEYANHGVSLSTDKTSSAKAWILNSRFDENGQSEYRPILYITYRNMSGFEDYWSYTSLSAGRNGSVSVNNYNGNLVFSQPLTQDAGGNLMPVNISLIYNSNGVNAPYTYMAKKMQTNFHVYVRYDSSTAEKKYKYYMNDADGTRHWFYFENLNDSTGKDEDGLGYTLDLIAVNSDSVCTAAHFRITDKDKNKMYFDGDGKLLQITNANGVSATVQYETVSGVNRIKSVTDGAGRIYSYKYSSTSPSLCLSIKDPAGRETSFEYGNGYLNKIIFPDGKSCNLTYNHNGNEVLANITSIDGTRTKITSDTTSQKRITAIDWGASDTNLLERYTFEYKQNETYVTDKQGRKFTYQFNDYGQLSGIISNADGSAKFFERAAGNSTDSKANKLLSESKAIKTVTNYVINPGFARDYAGYWTYAPDKTGTPSVTIDTEKSNLTKNSLKVYKPSNNTQNVMTVQNLSGITPGTYTLSGYVNTDYSTLPGNGVYLGVEFRDSSGKLVYTQKTEQINKTSGWQRISLTFTLPENHTLTFVSGFDITSYGTVWLDDFQIEKGTGTSSYNLVENSSFNNGTANWIFATTTGNLSGDMSYLGKYARITGDPSNKKSICSEVFTSGSQNDVLCIGAWAKANSAPTNNGTKNDDAHSPTFAIWVEFLDANNNHLKGTSFDFNPDVKSWQFLSSKIIAPVNYSKIKIYLIYEYNVNTADVTGMFCYKEEFGQTYDYDKDGNVSSVVDIAKTQSDFASKNNQLTKMLNPSGSEYFYSYAYNESDLSTAVSTDGQRYSFTYDNKGNVLTTKIEADKPALEVQAGKKYIIRNTYSGNVLDNNANKGTVHNWRYISGNANQIWQLESAGETDVYYLKSLSYGGLYMGVQDNSNKMGASIITSQTPSGDAYKFKIKSNGDGSFQILTKSSNYSYKISGVPSISQKEDFSDGVPVKQNGLVYKEFSNWYFYPDITSASGSTQDDYISSSASYSSNKNFMTSLTDQRGNTTSYSYNETKGTLTSETDPEGNTTNYTYDANTNALLSVSSGGMTNSYTYQNDRLTDINVNGKTRYKFTYDLFGRKVSTQVGNGTAYQTLSNLIYNSAGLLSRQNYGNGDYITFSYDALDRITEKAYNGDNSKKLNYYYGSDGRISQIADSASNSYTKYIYDLAGRTVSQREYSGTDLKGNSLISSVDYTYENKTNYLKAVKHFSPLGTQNISYEYGKIADGTMPDHVYKVRWSDAVFSYSYDKLGRISGKTVQKIGYPLGEELTSKYSYINLSGNKTTALISSLETPAGTYTYTYDKLGNVTSIHDGTNKTSYKYDELNQLIRVNDQKRNLTYIYSYDNRGNILSEKIYSYTESDDLGRLIEEKTWEYGNADFPDLLTKQGYFDISYDEIGNISRIYDTNFSWNGRQLESITSDDGYLKTTYSYDMEGKRISKTDNGKTTNFYYNGNILAGQKCGDDTLIFMYDESGDYFGLIYNGVEYFYIKNAQNDVVAIADASGNIVDRYYYDAWGSCYSSNFSSVGRINPIKYRSYYYDEECGFYYLNSRYYDPYFHRFINADSYASTGQGVLGNNMFAYCGNNPVARTDTTGEDWWHWVLGAAIVVGCAAAVVVTAGGAAAAAAAVVSVGSGVAAASTSATVAASAFIASGTALAAQIYFEGSAATSLKDFADRGNWGTVAVTAGSAAVGAASSYISVKSNTRSSISKAKTIQTTSRGSTATRQPSSLIEKLALEQVKSNPYNGCFIPLQMKDPRWPADEGWLKMQQLVNTSIGDINVHYLYNPNIDIFDDFKLK